MVSTGGIIAMIGVLAGGGAALALSRFLTAQLLGVSPGDPRVLTAVAGVLLTVAALASAVPAWRAARIDPMEALRHE